MIMRIMKRGKNITEVADAKGFDAFDLRLGDVMRGERATMGKSLLDVQRELRIKAAYIAAIENSDPTAFDTPGFIAGYVRSYARYLNMDPDWAFDKFCSESGFATAHGMSSAASSARPARPDISAIGEKDIFASPTTPFIPVGDSLFSGIEPGAVGSMLVLLTLIGGLGYGGWTVLHEVQKVQFAPVEQTPVVVSEVDPLAGGTVLIEEGGAAIETIAAFEAPSVEALDRLYRPAALDVPVLIARDGPISTLDPNATGTLAPLAGPNADATFIAAAAEITQETLAPVGVQVNTGPAPELVLFAVRPAWVRVRAADGSVIFEKIMDAGEEYILPATQEPPVLRAGNSGSLFFKVNGAVYGPAGVGTSTAKDVVLGADELQVAYVIADPTQDADLETYFAELAGASQ